MVDFLLAPLSSLITAAGLLAASPGGISVLPSVNMEESQQMARPGFIAHISDRSGNSLGHMFREGPISTPVDKLPIDFLNAVIAIEDRRFLEHRGIDPIGLALAAASQFGSSPRGGSSIDQQMAKNAWIGPEVSLRRKIPEALLALRAREELGSKAVLQLYLETAWFGRGVTGAAGAARAWFGKDWGDLGIGEMAYLAGILKGPGFYDAQRHPDRAVARRNQVLNAMFREGFISEEELLAEQSAPLEVSNRIARVQGHETRWAMSAAQQALSRAIDETVTNPSLLNDVEITLSIDQNWQSIAQNALRTGLRPLSHEEPFEVISREIVSDILQEGHDSIALREIARENLSQILPWDSSAQAGMLVERNGATWTLLLDTGALEHREIEIPSRITASPGQVFAFHEADGSLRAEGRRSIDGAVVVMDPRTGEVLASIGGAFPDHTSFDRTRALRQPGSAIKTFLYLAAFENGYTPEMWVSDTERDFVTEDGVIWRPRNYGRTQAGTVTLRTAFEQSSNLAAAHLIDEIGSREMGRIAEAAGVYPGGMRPHMTAALGTLETSLANITRGYATIANGGAARQQNVTHHLSVNGQVKISNGIRVGEGRMGTGPIARRSSIEDMISMMHGVTTRGTASQAFRGHPVTFSGKTGTTQGYRDAWFIGVSPHLAIGVWIGRDDNQPMSGRISGGRNAAPIAANILRQAFQAGMIDRDGFMPGSSDSAITWPPMRGSSPQSLQGMEVTGDVFNPVWEPVQSVNEPVFVDDFDPFWGSPVRQVQPAQPADINREFRTENRNEDLRINRW